MERETIFPDAASLPAGPGTSVEKRVAVLMAVRNGMPHLPAQIASIQTQDHANWCLLASDDASEDGSQDCLTTAAAADPTRIALMTGPGRGYGENFRALILNAPEADVATLADQDDIWLPERLSRGIARLEADGEAPAILLARRDLVDEDLGNRRPEIPLFTTPDFRNALFESVTPGNAMLINRAAFALIREAMHRAGPVGSHDWFIYQIASGAGIRILTDDRATILYRQHGGNAVGAIGGLGQLLRRIRRFSDRTYLEALTESWAGLARVADLLTPENRALLHQAQSLPTLGKSARARAFDQAGFHRVRRADHLLLRHVLLRRLSA
ncbi:glycosyltransferase [Paracoccus aminophilus]|uniref:Glycosyl transferase n=1 Tax=Paracoccus aminophilus JCM 7686 TaxID=1367847 RepID=S5Y3Y7_PARAH|nr:glycosyltransferase [Paracoccus aminophilus]AGT10450.1 glycosyl transferase [Paracoccus aminophilus JCM 7686]